MKNTYIRSIFVILAVAGMTLTMTPRAQAQGQSKAEAIALLTSGMWHFKGASWSNDRVFDAKGTVMVRASNAEGPIKWKIDAKQVTITFKDHQDFLFLPIDPKGTKGMDGHLNDIIATQIPDSLNANPAATPATALSALTATPPPAVNAATIATQLTSKKWKFDGASWSETRVFTADGTMTVDNTDRVAKWAVSGDKVVITFPDHKDILYLPLDPKGTKGADANGRLFVAAQVEATPTPKPGSSVPGVTAPPTNVYGTKTEPTIPVLPPTPTPPPAR